MNPLLRKSIICLVPVLLSIWAFANALANDSFKLGVDLSGGTILVYEIDPRVKRAESKADPTKKKDDKEETSEGVDPTERSRVNADLLARKLKERIDPNDLYNIVIRPAGGENRVEI